MADPNENIFQPRPGIEMIDPDKLDFQLPEGVDEGDHIIEYQIPGMAPEKLRVLGGLGILQSTLDSLESPEE